MCAPELIVLCYHKFTEEPSDYQFSRTFIQFINDLDTKTFDWITIDDGLKSIVRACEIMREKNIRAKLFITTGLVGTEGYCTWNELKKLSEFHDIENHSHEHVRHTWLSPEEIFNNINDASIGIQNHIGKRPRYFVPPYNNSDKRVEAAASMLGLQLISGRVDILNTSE